MSDGNHLADILDRMLDKNGDLHLAKDQARMLIDWIRRNGSVMDQNHVFLLRLYEELGK